MKFKLKDTERKNKLLENEYNSTMTTLEKIKMDFKELDKSKLEMMEIERQ